MSRPSTQETLPTIEENARQLVTLHARDATIERIYFFPASEEIRLIETDPLMPPAERIFPFYFGESPAEEIYYSLAIALIHPDDLRRLPLPEGWGTWDDAVLVWENSRA